MDLLLHEVTVVTQLGTVAQLRAGMNCPYRNFSGAIVDKTLGSPNIRDVTVFKYLVLPRHWQQCIDVRRYKIFSIGAAEQQRGALTGSDKPARFTSMHHSERKAAVQLSDCGPHGLSKIQPVLQVQIHLMYHNLCIGFGTETQACSTLCIAQRLVVFNDSVADECQGAVTDMRMRIRLSDAAMRCPAGMSDSSRACERRLAQSLLKLSYFTDCSRPIKLSSWVDHHHSGRIVPAVFQPAQAFEQKTACFRCSDRSDNAAHNLVYSFEKSSDPAAHHPGSRDRLSSSSLF